MFRVTPAQVGHFKEIQRLKCPVAFLGIDTEDRPVLARVDANGYKAYSVMVDGRSIDVAEGPLRQDLTDEELEALSPSASEVLFALPMDLPHEPTGGSDG